MKKLKVGVIGLNNIVRLHMPGWHLSPYTEVVAAADIDEDILQKWGQNNNIDNLYSNPLDLISNPEIDIIDICTPNNFHCELAIKSLEAGKHVLCEKPLAPTAEEIQKMIEARDKSSKKLMCSQHFRFRNESQSISNEIKSIYPVYHARSWMLRRNFFNVTKGFLQKKESGGGPCIDIGVHVLDLTLLFMGHPKPISVTGVSKTELAKEDNAYSPMGEYDKSSMDVEDFAAAFVRFENGASLIFEVSWMLHHKMPEDDKEDMQIWLYGKNGGMHWPSCEKLTTNSKEKKEINTVYKINTENVIEPHALGCMEFANAVFNDIKVPVPAEHSYQVMQILNAIYESQKLGKEILL